MDPASAAALDRAAQEDHGVPGLVLMELAARGVAEVATWLLGPGSRALVVCGRGNNGGDGLAVARNLLAWGHPVDVVLLHGPPTTPDARREAEAARTAGIALADATQDDLALARALEGKPDLVVDAIFGIGLTRELSSSDVATLELLRGTRVPVLAVDVPSGLHAGTGKPLPVALRALITATMVAPKTGFARARDVVGHVVCVDIGLPPSLLPPRVEG
ncbi:MAG: NAD(P)H-hydrate epimerase [Planctomycetota bacterium]